MCALCSYISGSFQFSRGMDKIAQQLVVLSVLLTYNLCRNHKNINLFSLSQFLFCWIAEFWQSSISCLYDSCHVSWLTYTLFFDLLFHFHSMIKLHAAHELFLKCVILLRKLCAANLITSSFWEFNYIPSLCNVFEIA